MNNIAPATRKALITGVTGQDGAYLAAHLLEQDYEVVGAYRRSAQPQTANLQFLGVSDRLRLVPLELLEYSNIVEVLKQEKPDELYNLGAQSFVAASFQQPQFTSEVTGLGTLRLLDAVRQVAPEIRFYQASSSEMFGLVQETPQHEGTRFHPRSPYAAAKLFAHWCTVNYREAYGLFGCSGILFNHESPLRGHEFVTRKITNSLAQIQNGIKDKLVLGNLSSRRDWGFAGDYVRAMSAMLQRAEADDYVVATGETHSVRDFVDAACAVFGLNIEWNGEGAEEKGIDRSTGRTVIEVSPEFYRPAEVELLCGDASKARSQLNWTPTVSFSELVERMCERDQDLVRRETGVA